MSNTSDFPLSCIGDASNLLLYEGLPHDWIEAELFAQEQQTKAIVHRNNFPFYQETLTPTPEDTEHLTDFFVAEDAFIPWKDWKRCGGFHPDFCLEWNLGSNIYRVLICFSCDEILISTPTASSKWDLRRSYKPFVYDSLIRYQKNRPIKWRTTAEKEREDRILKAWYTRRRRRLDA